ncbi:MAG: methyltransferase domain-containing protein [Flavobacteriales bacterium]|jgi:hypothetical protein|nr:methyltransferase domain-containing protein [Flavobacteriales bacterium]
MDAFGNAALDFLNDNNDEFIYVESKTMEDDVIPVKHLFRSLDQMPYCEQKAIEIAKGKVLDVGGGVGSHCLVLQEKGLDTTMLDFSPGLCEASTKRGVKNVIEADFFKWKTDQKFDTLLFMMNGIGIGGSFELFQKTIVRSFELLNEGGQILFDSTDIAFCYELEDGSLSLPLNLDYTGFVEFKLTYKNQEDSWFNWAYYDADKIIELLGDAYNFEIIHQEKPAYTGRITKK